MTQSQSHCVSSPGSHDECRTVPDGCRPLDQADGLESLSRLITSWAAAQTCCANIGKVGIFTSPGCKSA